MRNGVKLALLLVLGLALAHAAESGKTPQVSSSEPANSMMRSGAAGTQEQVGQGLSSSIDQSMIGASREYGPEPRPPTDDSSWIIVGSIPTATQYQCIDVSGDVVWLAAGNAGQFHRRSRLTGALIASFPAHSPGSYPYGICRFGDSICLTYFYTGSCDVYDSLGNYARSFTVPGQTIHGIDWDGTKFWATTGTSSIITMTRTGTVLRTLTGSGSSGRDLALDETYPNRLWVDRGTPPHVGYCAFDTSANTYQVLASFPSPTGNYTSGLGYFCDATGGYSYHSAFSDAAVYQIRVHDNGAPYKVMVLHADNGSSAVRALADMLRDSSGGQFAVVDTYSIQTNATFPATAWFNSGYRAILAFTDYAPYDPVRVGDSLARFIELGGGVVDAGCADFSGWAVSGRYRAAYSPFTVQSRYFGTAAMGTVHYPTHPIMSGVTVVSYSLGVSTGNTHSTLRGGNSVCLAEWSGGTRCVAACFDSGGRRAASLGFFPLADWIGYPNGGQWVRLIENALQWTVRPLPLPSDVGVDAVRAPGWYVQPGAVTAPVARIRYFGGTVSPLTSIPVTCWIDSAGVRVYNRDVTWSGSLKIGDTARVTFPNWTPGPAFNSYQVTMFTNLSGDLNHANDLLKQTTLVSTPFKVLYYAADVNIAGMAAYLLANCGGAFSAVDAVDGRSVPLRNMDSLLTVAGYKAILTWPNSPYYNSVAVGDSLARYVELGGGVVAPTWCEYGPGNHLQGRFETQYMPVPNASNSFLGGSLGTVYAASHPIMSGVSTLSASSYVTAVTTIAHPSYTTRVADFAAGQVEAAAFDSAGRRVAFLGFWPSTDDVSFTGDAIRQLDNALVWTVIPHDIGVTGIVSPAASVPPGAVSPQVLVHNYGLEREGGKVFFRINSSPPYSESLSLAGLPLTDTTLTFPSWTGVPGTYTARCSTYQMADHTPVNDTVSKSFQVGHMDVQALSITTPTGSFDTSVAVSPSAQVKNAGDFPATFDAWFFIDTVGGNAYSQHITVSSVAPGATVPADFPAWAKPHLPHAYSARCSVWIAADEHPENDRQTGSFTVTLPSSLPLGWTARTELPLGGKSKNVKDGGALVYGKEGTDVNDTGYVYAFKGNNRYEFYRYNTITNTWAAKESIPAVNRNNKKKGVKKGSSLAYGTDGKVYATKGNNTLDLWQYDPLTGVWTQKTDVPTGAKNCKEGTSSAAVKEGSDNYVYLLRGSGTYDFYRYNTATDAWDVTLPTAPGGTSTKPYKNGSSITYDGGDTIYCLKGSYNEFAAYSISGKTWATRSLLPLVAPPGTKKKKVKDGSQIAADRNQSVYGLKGGNTNEFWMFSTSDQTWHVQTELPVGSKRVKGGGALTYAEDLGVFYAFRGNNTREYWVFNPGSMLGARRAALGESKAIQGSSSLIVHRFSLSVTPNPFTSSLNPSISFSLPTPGNVSLKLYDVTGKLVSTLASGYRSAGTYAYRLPPTAYRLSAGVYLLKFETDSYRTTEKLVIE